jgi:hypothetical protein
MDVKVSTPSMVRGAGVTAAMLVPGSNRFSRFVRTGLVGAGYLGSFAIEPERRPEHYTLLSFEDTDDVSDDVRRYANMTLGTASWIGIQALIAHAATLLPLPKVIKAAALGGAVAVADGWLGERVRSAKAV